jgi:hypothetical protein
LIEFVGSLRDATGAAEAAEQEAEGGDLACAIQSFCLYLFPNGKYRNRMYCVGSLEGEPGNSLKICLSGEKVGMWKDFATGEGGNNLLDLLYRVRGGELHGCMRGGGELAE